MSTARNRKDDASGALRRLMLLLRKGPVSFRQALKAMTPFGAYGTEAGARMFLDDLIRGWVIVPDGRRREAATGPLEPFYRLRVTVCRDCGCTDMNACVDAAGEPCHWTEPELCSACARTTGKGVPA